MSRGSIAGWSGELMLIYLFIYFKETAKLFSHVALKLSIPITNVREIQFIYIFIKIWLPMYFL